MILKVSDCQKQNLESSQRKCGLCTVEYYSTFKKVEAYTCYPTDGLHRCYAQCNKTDTEGQIPCDFTHVRAPVLSGVETGGRNGAQKLGVSDSRDKSQLGKVSSSGVHGVVFAQQQNLTLAWGGVCTTAKLNTIVKPIHGVAGVSFHLFKGWIIFHGAQTVLSLA